MMAICWGTSTLVSSSRNTSGAASSCRAKNMICREVDIGLVLALLLGVADGDAFERIDAVHAVLSWRSRRQQVTEGAAALYVAALKVSSPPQVTDLLTMKAGLLEGILEFTGSHCMMQCAVAAVSLQMSHCKPCQCLEPF